MNCEIHISEVIILILLHEYIPLLDGYAFFMETWRGCFIRIWFLSSLAITTALLWLSSATQLNNFSSFSSTDFCWIFLSCSGRLAYAGVDAWKHKRVWMWIVPAYRSTNMSLKNHLCMLTWWFCGCRAFFIKEKVTLLVHCLISGLLQNLHGHFNWAWAL